MGQAVDIPDNIPHIPYQRAELQVKITDATACVCVLYVEEGASGDEAASAVGAVEQLDGRGRCL